MHALVHRARLLAAAIEMGDLEFAAGVAKLHERELRAALDPTDPLIDLEPILVGYEPDDTLQTPAGGVGVPMFSIAIAGGLEGRLGIAVDIEAATIEDEQRLWRWILDHPDIGEPVKRLLSVVDMINLDA